MKRKVDIVIIGAGLTGLTTAFYLQKFGKKVLVLEKLAFTGGVMQTGVSNGFVYEKGPNTGVIGNTEVVQLFDDLGDSCELEIANPEAKKRLIWKKGKWNPLPSGHVSAITTPLFTLKDKLRILGEPWRKPGKNPNESVADLVRRRMGESFLDYAVDPFISGIYAGNPEKLVTKYALPKLYAIEQQYGSFIKGAIKKRKLPKTELEKRVSREVFSTKKGLNQLIQALTSKVNTRNILTEVKDCVVSKNATGFTVQGNYSAEPLEIAADVVISTINAPSLPSILPFIAKEKLQTITKLKYAKVAQVILGFKLWDGCDVKAFGGLVPSKEKKDVLGALFTSSFLAHRAPDGGLVISTFVGGVQHEDIFNLRDKDLLERVHAELSLMLETDTRRADLIELLRYPHAIPQYDIHSSERLKAITQLEQEHPGLVLAGNIRDGIGMADRIKQARQISETIAKNNP